MPARLAILADYPEEGWVSMNLCAEMLCRELASTRHAESFSIERICPRFKRRFSQLPGIGKHDRVMLMDRLINRLRDYPRHVAGRANEFDLFHVVDHSYAAVVHALPAERTGVYCHDLDAFRCILDPENDRRPRWYRSLARHILRGMQSAAVVFHSTMEVRRQIEHYGLIDPSRLVQAPMAAAPEFTEIDGAPPDDPQVLKAGNSRFVLHVGSCVARKRIDVLLEVFARIRLMHRDVILVKAGGVWSSEQRRQIDRLGIVGAIVHMRHVDRLSLAWLYRRAEAVLMTSEAEGFGLPVIEALACGAPLVASDIPVLREVAGDAANYAPLGDIDAWAATAESLLSRHPTMPSKQRRLEQSALFSWERHGDIIASAYQRRLTMGSPTERPPEPVPR